MNNPEDVKRQIENLRLLADWMERHPEAEAPAPAVGNKTYCRLHASTKEELTEQLRAVGSFVKRPCSFDDKDFEFVVTLTNGYEIIYFVPREMVCEKRVVGKRHIEEKYIPGRVEPAHDEEIVEWDCGESVLNPSPEADDLDIPEEAQLTFEADDLDIPEEAQLSFESIKVKPRVDPVEADFQAYLKKLDEEETAG